MKIVKILGALFEQKLSEDSEEAQGEKKASICHLYGYGFAWQRHGVLGKLREEIGSLIDVIDPEHFAIDSRSDFCREMDEDQFSADYYL